jgi:hypothetical protein
MALAETVRPARVPSRERIVSLIGLTLAIGYAVALIGAWLQGSWLIDPQGRPVPNDFVNVWATGSLTLEGHAIAAYDLTLLKAAEVRAVGHHFADYYGWPYPPTFLFVAAGIGSMPYTTAALVWLAATLTGYLAAIRAIIGHRAGVLFGLGFPATIWNVTAEQNGFLTASLIGGTLALMQRRPALAGVCLGLLTYKPQFGLLFPLVLIAAGCWRVIGFAAATAVAMAALSWLAFGTAPWIAFVQGLGTTSEIVLDRGLGDLERLQSVFGFVRAHGASMAVAWAIQGAVAVITAIWLCLLWRTRAAFEVKAAALAAGALLATPYIYMYDLVVLAVPAAFLLRLMLKDEARRVEIAGLALAGLLILIFPYVKTHVGLAATMIVFSLIAARACYPAGYRPGWISPRH